jgi:hypothetical protein
MQKILKFVEKSSLVQDFKIHDFKTGKEFAYLKLEILFKNSSKVHIREFLNAKQRKYSFHWILDNRTEIRWDNSPHHKDIRTCPHHLHVNQDTFPSECSDPVKILAWIETLLTKNEELGPETILSEIGNLH